MRGCGYSRRCGQHQQATTKERNENKTNSPFRIESITIIIYTDSTMYFGCAHYENAQHISARKITMDKCRLRFLRSSEECCAEREREKDTSN